MIRFDQVTITYDGADAPVLKDVCLDLEEGELCLVVGHTGAGKSTLLGAVNGLVPHFTGGALRGRVAVGGFDTALTPPRELADVVGVVGQDPIAGFVTDTVEEELAYTMEQLALPAATMRTRVEEFLDLFGIADLRHRALHELSGGQQQRVAIAAAMTAHPRVLVLDEPTSSLDPTSAEDVLAAITRLVHDLGVTVVLAEHRLERVLAYADRIVHVNSDGTVSTGTAQELMETADVAPPVVQLGRALGWRPLPLAVRDARRHASLIRRQLPVAAAESIRATGPEVLHARGITVRYGDLIAVRELHLDLRAREVTALMGRNGSGKSSLLWALQGAGPRQSGSVDVAGSDPRKLNPAQGRQLVGLVPQTPSDLLYLDSVKAELAQADRDARAGDDNRGEPGGARRLLDRIAPGIADDTHPRDLSAGQQLALVLAIQLAAGPRILLLDEPTRGLDYEAKRGLTRTLNDLAEGGHSVLIATHDVEFAAIAAGRVVVMADGAIVADGPAAEILTASPTFAPQIAKIMAPSRYLTLSQVVAL